MTEPPDPFESWLNGSPVVPLPPRPGGFERISRTARRRRWARVGATGATVMVLLATIASVISALGEPGPGVGTQPGVTDSASTPPATATPDTSTSAGPSQAPARPCTAAQVHITVIPGDSAAGHIGLRVEFSNISTDACTLRGYPVVSFVNGPSGNQVGNTAHPAAGPLSTVPLAPNATAHANLLLVNVANYPPSSCGPQQVGGVLVQVPGDPTRVFAASSQLVCTLSGTGVAQIYPIAGGH
jgi:hypothetical protein